MSPPRAPMVNTMEVSVIVAVMAAAVTVVEVAMAVAEAIEDGAVMVEGGEALLRAALLIFLCRRTVVDITPGSVADPAAEAFTRLHVIKVTNTTHLLFCCESLTSMLRLPGYE